MTRPPPHDKLLRVAMEHPQVTIDFLHHNLPIQVISNANVFIETNAERIPVKE